MENTKENKLRFICQYLNSGVQVRLITGSIIDLSPNTITDIAIDPTSFTLLLNNINVLTDEECIKFHDFVNPDYEDSDLAMFGISKIEYVREWNWYLMNPKSRDYLRSKGIIAPFFDLVGSEILNYGWAELRE